MADVTYVVDGGLDILTNRIISAGTEPKFVAWGTGGAAALTTDTGLQTAAAEARTSGTSSRALTSTANDTYQVVGTIACTGAGKTITEVALYDALTVGNCFLHGSFTGIALNVGDSIAFTIKSQFNQA